jgi:hypothetical protein
MNGGQRMGDESTEWATLAKLPGAKTSRRRCAFNARSKTEGGLKQTQITAISKEKNFQEMQHFARLR